MTDNSELHLFICAQKLQNGKNPKNVLTDGVVQVLKNKKIQQIPQKLLHPIRWALGSNALSSAPFEMNII